MRPLPRDLGIGFGTGAFSGVFGVGGGILLVPIQVLGFHIEQKKAQATSLVMVAMAAVAATITYGVGDQVAWIPAIAILIGGIAGSLIGSYVVTRSANRILQAAFGVIMIAAAVRLLVHVEAPGDVARTFSVDWTVLAYALSGLAMGVLSALFGIGGGIILIPILVAFFGYPQQLAAGTSLAVMGPIALVGAVRLTRPGLTDWRRGSRYGLGAISGGVLGAALALWLSGSVLRAAFAAVLIVVGLRMLWQGADLPRPRWRSRTR